jgi:hypothetical protein
MGLRDYVRLPADGRFLKPRQGFKNWVMAKLALERIAD